MEGIDLLCVFHAELRHGAETVGSSLIMNRFDRYGHDVPHLKID